MRVVLDTNIIVSGLFWRGQPGFVLRAATEQKFRLLLSETLIAELLDVLSREKFKMQRQSLGMSAEQIVADLRVVAEVVHPADVPSSAVRDVKDAMVIACAIGGNAEVIVSGDQDLLSLGTYARITIVDARGFLAILTGETPSDT
ncbi:MAG: putative toxin-antitoxin system toxin component, PIN family [Anaerolineae bacterium]|nr:putative toxin-antitoxin system toxin component, PIN family [Anaerolineae bacterium]